MITFSHWDYLCNRDFTFYKFGAAKPLWYEHLDFMELDVILTEAFIFYLSNPWLSIWNGVFCSSRGQSISAWPTRNGEWNFPPFLFGLSRISMNTWKSPGLCCLIVFSALLFVQNRFDHPYVSFLFYGMDAAGDFIPIKQLREKYNRPRYEIPIDPENEWCLRDPMPLTM